jgi:hypothetical protein
LDWFLYALGLCAKSLVSVDTPFSHRLCGRGVARGGDLSPDPLGKSVANQGGQRSLPGNLYGTLGTSDYVLRCQPRNFYGHLHYLFWRGFVKFVVRAAELAPILEQIREINVKLKKQKNITPVLRAVIEMGSIIFLFYSNLLMGEFTNSNSAQGKTLLFAIQDVFSMTNFIIAVISSLLGYVVFEYLRKKL